MSNYLKKSFEKIPLINMIKTQNCSDYAMHKNKRTKNIDLYSYVKYVKEGKNISSGMYYDVEIFSLYFSLFLDTSGIRSAQHSGN